LDWSKYHRYINSPEWRARRKTYFQKHPPICARCKTGEHIHLHHMTYDRLGEELDVDMVPLCEPCHDQVHKLHRESASQNLTVATMLWITHGPEAFNKIRFKKKSPKSRVHPREIRNRRAKM